MPSDANAIRRWLHDMQHHLVLAQNFVAGMSCEALRDDLRTTYAVTRCLEIISEASRRLPDELKARHPSRELIRTGTAEGRARAKANGVKLGSKPKLMPHQRRELIIRRDEGDETVREIARSYNINASTISRVAA